MKVWLNKPFPIIYSLKQKLITSFLFASFVFVFLIVFQPFGISDIHFNKLIFVLGFFVITFVVMTINFLLAPLILKNAFDSEGWTVKKNIYFIVCQILIISFFNWFYTSTIGEDITVQYNLFSFLFITISIGIFPTIFFTIYVEKYLFDRHRSIAKKLTNIVHIPEIANIKISIFSKNNKESVILGLKQLLCIKSEGNYSNIFYFEDSMVKKKLIRNSLSQIIEQLKSTNSIKRCHHSYIVNLQNVIKVSGNARNFNLHLEKLDFSIPVSRNFPKTIIESIKS